MHPERREKLDAVRCDNLAPHSLSVKIYGKPEPTKELLDSIAKHGLLQPLIINDYDTMFISTEHYDTGARVGHYEILAGNTRAAAWRMLLQQKRIKSNWIPCRILHLPQLEAEQLIIESNRQREKTPGQKAREASELARIETALAEQRMTLGVKNASPRKGKVTDIVAKQTGQSNRTVEKQIAIVEKADAGDAVAQHVLADMDKSEISVSEAYRQITPQREPTLNSTPLGQRMNALETIARKLPGDLTDPANKKFIAEVVTRLSAVREIFDRAVHSLVR
jgi:hypothetical protein